ncbi:MAG: Hsp20/alpha crystallin family protein [Candidatus Hecatellales archaeon]|nr:MAG: Hsp20/alpha crystallin family protein [Candidatus Hecatellales archaeon]
MVWDEFFEDWFKRRRRFPFFREFDEIVRDMERMFEEAFKEFREMPEGLVREKRLPDGRIVREYGPMVYGYSITIGPDGKPVIREFGNVKPSMKTGALDVKSEREPLVDIMEEAETIKVIAEVPGVEKNDIQLYGTERSLTIKVDTPTRKYFKEVELPAEVDPKSAKSTYKNGVLEVILKKTAPKPKGQPIRIE